MITLEAPAWFRRLMLAFATALVGLALALGVFLWRLSTLFQVDGDQRAAAMFLLLGTLMTLQGMVIVGLAWLIVAVSRVVLRHDAAGLTLEHPWRRWHGDAVAVRQAWQHGPWLVLEIDGEWRRWYVWAKEQHAALEQFRGLLPAGAWLEGREKRRHLARTVLPPVLAAIGAAGLLGVWLLSRTGAN
ncbi:MAG TPA: hypothetical protein VF198_08275 [Vicinamibacterales bacterium]